MHPPLQGTAVFRPLKNFCIFHNGETPYPYLRKEESTISFWSKKKSSADISTELATPPIAVIASPQTRKEPNRRRSEKVTLRMTPEERELLRSKAALVGLTQTDLIFSSIQNGVFIILDEAQPLLVELRKQGINLNQIVRHLHQLDLSDPTILEQAIHSCVAAQTELVRFCKKWNVIIKKEANAYRNRNDNGIKSNAKESTSIHH